MTKILVKLGRRLKISKMVADKNALHSPTLDRKLLEENRGEIVKASPLRWYILATYVYYATTSSSQWVTYSIVTNIVMRYYNVSSSAVDWSGIMFMIVWPIFVFPSSFLIDKLKIRWYILIIYSYYTVVSSFQWIQYSIIENIATKYYNVNARAVHWTSILFSIVWPIFVFPSMPCIEGLGLRFAALAGCLLTILGAGVKLFSIDQSAFWVVLIGQAIVSLSQVFILSLPPKLAVTWFKPNEVSTVCSIGVFGMQLGCALGFLIPPMIVKDVPDLIEIGLSLKRLCWGLFIVVIPACVAVIVYFPNMPKYPPSAAQAEERKNAEQVTMKTFLKTLQVLIKNKGFMVQMLGYSINFGIFSAFGTLLNQFVLSYFPGAAEDAGRMGLVMILFGMSGGFLVGIVLDKTHKFKETNFLIYLGSVICLGALLVCLQLKAKMLVYLTIAVFGFFLNAYIPAGIEFASELTYPANESTTTGLMTAASQTLGVIFTLILSIVSQKWGSFWAMVIQICLLAFGTLLTALVPNNLRRQEAFNRSAEFAPLPQKDTRTGL